MISDRETARIHKIIDSKIEFHSNGVFSREDLTQEAIYGILKCKKQYGDILKGDGLLNLIIFRSILDYVCKNQYIYSISPKSARKYKYVLYQDDIIMEYREPWEQIDLEMELTGNDLLVYRLLVGQRSHAEISEVTGLTAPEIKGIIDRIRTIYES